MNECNWISEDSSRHAHLFSYMPTAILCDTSSIHSCERCFCLYGYVICMTVTRMVTGFRSNRMEVFAMQGNHRIGPKSITDAVAYLNYSITKHSVSKLGENGWINPVINPLCCIECTSLLTSTALCLCKGVSG